MDGRRTPKAFKDFSKILILFPFKFVLKKWLQCLVLDSIWKMFFKYGIQVRFRAATRGKTAKTSLSGQLSPQTKFEKF